MNKKSDQISIHQKIELLISEMVDREINLKDALGEFEKIYLETAAKKYNGNQTLMSKALGIHRNTLHNRAKVLKIKKKN